MGIFDWIRGLGVKESPAQRGLYLMTGGRPQFTPAKFDQLAKKGFEQNVTVFACVSQIASSAAGVPWKVYRRNRKDGSASWVPDHPLQKLMDRPNPTQGQGQLIEAMTAFTVLAGNSYLKRVGPDNPNRPPIELWGMRPDRVQVVPGRDQLVAAYRYKVGQVQQDFDAALVFHQKTFSATSDWYGLAPLTVAARAVDADNAAQAWNVALLQNSARPSGFLVAKGNLEDTQFDRLKAQIDEQFQGTKNAGRPGLLEGDMSWIQVAMNARDMDWLSGRKLSRQEICQAFQVPPELVGDKEHATYSNYQEARRSFYEETILPYLDRLRDGLNRWLTPLYGDDLFLDYDRDQIEALSEDRDKLWTRIGGAKFLTINEQRAMVKLEPIDGGDVILVPMAQLPLGDVASPSTTEGTKGGFLVIDGKKRLNVPEGVSSEALKGATAAAQVLGFPEAAKALDVLAKSVALVQREADAALDLKAFNIRTAEGKANHRQAVDRAREAWSGKLATQVVKYFQDTGKAVAGAVEGASNGEEAERLALAAIDAKRGTLERILAQTMVEVVRTFGQAVLDQLKTHGVQLETKDTFDPWAAAVQRWIATVVADNVRQIDDTTKTMIRAALAEGVAAGEGADVLARRLTDAFQGMTTHRALMIARTEVAAAAGFGSQEAAKQTGLKLVKEWISASDDRTRDSHLDGTGVGGQVVKMEARYGNGLMYPGDMGAGKPAEVINCRCAEGYLPDED